MKIPRKMRRPKLRNRGALGAAGVCVLGVLLWRECSARGVLLLWQGLGGGQGFAGASSSGRDVLVVGLKEGPSCHEVIVGLSAIE